MTACGSCAAKNAADAKFCNQCGTALQAPASSPVPAQRRQYTPQHLQDKVLKHRSAMQGERKQVTVLFADMAGSTGLAEQVDAEQWHLILDEFFSILSNGIHRFEGTVNQYTGDGIMALFGAPLALEDHAQRAAYAALELRGQLRRFADRLRLQQGINLATRMGMNSGEVVVGSIGDDLRMDYTAQGLTVNLAARMEQIAQPGSIFVTRHSADLMSDYFRLDALGPMPVKGSTEAVEVFELRGKTDISLRLEAARQRGLSGFCGRDQELQQLKQIQQASHGGQRQLCVVRGDAGLGKSRLCDEASSIWQQQGIEVIRSSGVPHGQAVPLQPVRHLILQRFRVEPQDEPKVARQKIAGGLLLRDAAMRDQLELLFDFLGIAAGTGRDDLVPEAREHRLREMFRHICLCDAEQARVILIDDLHWLDEGSLEFLQIMLDCEANNALLVLLNMRPGAMPDWLADHQPQMLELQPLNQAAMTRLCAELLGAASGMEELAQRLAGRAAGNPFFAEEAVRALHAKGMLQGQPGQYHLQAAVQDLDIPATVQATIAARVDLLASDEKSLLQLAAVCGQDSDRQLLLAASDYGEAVLSQHLQALRLGHYLEPADSLAAHWRFAHPLMREVIYASLLREQRLALHRRIAQELQQQLGERPTVQQLLLLAQHWHAVDEPLQAAHWGYAAAIQLAPDNALEGMRVARQIIAWLGPEPGSDEGRRLAIQARALVLRAVGFHQSSDENDIELLYQQGYALAQDYPDKTLLAELLISNGVHLLNRAHADKAVDNTGQAMALAQQVASQQGNETLEQRFRIPILFSYFSAGRLNEGMQVLDQRDGGAWHEGDMREDTMLSRGFRALMLAAMGQLTLAEQESRSAMACLQAHGRQVSWMSANTVDIQLQRGVLGDSPQLAAQALEYARRFGHQAFEEVAQRAVAQVLIAQGRADEAVACLLQSQPHVQDGGAAAQFRAAHGGSLSLALLANGQAPEALQQAEQAVAAGMAARQRVWTIRALLAQAKAQLQLGKTAHSSLQQLQSLIQETGAQLYQAELLELRARQSAEADQQRQFYQQAAELWRGFGAPQRADVLLQGEAA